MPEHDPHEQTDPAGESFDHPDDESADPTDQGAHSADSGGTSPAADSSPAETGYVDQSLLKLDKLAGALNKLSQASAEDAFNAKIRQLTQLASDAQDAPGNQAAAVESTEPTQEPVDSQVQSPPQPQIDEAPPAAPEVPVETTALIESNDEQIVAPPLNDSETLDAPFDPAEIVKPLEAFAPSGLDDPAPSTDDESLNDAEAQQPEPEDTGQTSEDVRPEVITAAHELDEAAVGGQDSDSVPQTRPSGSDVRPESPDNDPAAADLVVTDAEAPGSVETSFGADQTVVSEDETEPVHSSDEDVVLGPASDEEQLVEPDPVPPTNVESKDFEAPDSQSLDPIAAEQESAVLDEHSKADESDSAVLDDVEEKALSSASDSSLDAQVVHAPPEPVDDSEIESSDEIVTGATADIQEQSIQGTDPPTEIVEPAAQEPAQPSDALDDIEPDLVAPSDEQPDSYEGPNVPPDTLGDIEATSTGVDQPDEPLAAEQDAQAETLVGASDAPLAPQPPADSVRNASKIDNQGAFLTAQELESQIGEINSSSDEVQQASPRQPLPRAAASNLAEGSDSPAPPTDVDLDWLAKELDVLLTPGAAEPDSGQPSESSRVGDPVIEGAANQEVDAPELSDQASTASDERSWADDAPDATGDEVDGVAELEDIASEQAEAVSEIDATQSAQSQEELAPTEPIGAGTSIEDESIEPASAQPLDSAGDDPDDLVAPSADDELSEITSQLDELLDGNAESGGDQTPSDPVEEASPAIDTAAPPGEAQPTGESLEDAPQVAAQVSPESGAVDEPVDFMASPAGGGGSEINQSPANEVEPLTNEGLDSTDDATQGDAAQTFMTETGSDDAPSTEAVEQTFAETETPREEPATAVEPEAPDSQSAGVSDFMMDQSGSTGSDVQPEAEAQADFDNQSQDTADPESISSNDDDDADASATEEMKEAAVATVRLVRLHAALERIEPVAVPILRRVNYPLRYVPQALRPIVDWVALSLLFWVPIVWVIALLAK